MPNVLPPVWLWGNLKRFGAAHYNWKIVPADPNRKKIREDRPEPKNDSSRPTRTENRFESDDKTIRGGRPE